jgi:hypothetical protein
MLSVAVSQQMSDEQQDRTDKSHRQRHMVITLFKAVTLNDLRSVTLHFTGNPNNTCLCFFGAQVATSLESGDVRVCHVDSLVLCPGAGIVAPAVREEETGTAHGQGMRFDTKSPAQLDLQEPVDVKLAQSTLSLVLELARVAEHAKLIIWCGARGVEIFNDAVSCVRTIYKDAKIWKADIMF